MTTQGKQALSKTLICLGATVAAIPMWVTMTIPAIRGRPSHGWPPTWGSAMMATASVVVFAGVILGSRGLGKPLTVGRLFSQLFAFPCWIPVSVYLVGFGAGFFFEAVAGS